MTLRTQDLLACALLTGLWWLPALVIGIAGEFPISDDWSYAHTVQLLLETGRFERPAWTWAPSLTNVGLGAAFSWPGGFSFAALRLSTLFAGWLGVLACFGLARGIGAGVAAATLAAACLATNPIYVNLSFTFMTDIAFVALTTGSLVALAAALRSRHIAAWVAAGALVFAAMLSRQPAIMLPVAAGAALLLAHRKRPVVWFVTGGLALLAVGVYTALPYFYGSGDGGFEFNGLFNFAKDDRDWSRFKEKPGSRWVVDDEYVVSEAVELPGYEPIAERGYSHRLPPAKPMIRVYHRRITE
ncbi:MAG: glycosyltransferase family 39 protein [bacterium]|nr:glycosyltransferase family 39 protein [bacterium]